MNVLRSRYVLFVLIILSVLSTVAMFVISRWQETTLPIPQAASQRTISPQLSGLPITESMQTASDAAYVLPVFREQSSTLQINGILEGFSDDWVSITAQDRQYLASVTQTSYVECRNSTVVGSDGKTVPAHTIFYDLSRYILNLKENGKTMVEKGQILLYPQAKARLSKDVNVLGVVEKGEANKGNTLFFLIVYGCL